LLILMPPEMSLAWKFSTRANVSKTLRRWVKGVHKLNSLEQSEALRAQKLMLACHRPDVSLKVNGSLGEATFGEAIYGPILDLLADHKPKTLGQSSRR
jgi:hypothetical protein